MGLLNKGLRSLLFILLGHVPSSDLRVRILKLLGAQICGNIYLAQGLIVTTLGTDDRLDQLIIEDQAIEIDRVDYDLSFVTSGKSKELSVNHLSDVLNDILTNWCDAVSVFGDGDLGTPRSLNDCVLSP